MRIRFNAGNGSKIPNGSFDSVLFSAITVIFMVYWTIAAVRGGARLLGLLFGGYGLYTTSRNFIVNLKAYMQNRRDADFYGYQDYNDYREYTGKNDDYYNQSSNNSFAGNEQNYYTYTDKDGNIYCPYCGVKVAHDFEYCPKCGKKLPF